MSGPPPPPLFFRQPTMTDVGAGAVDPAEPGHAADSDELPPASVPGSVPLFTRLATEQPVERDAPAEANDTVSDLPSLPGLAGFSAPLFQRHQTTTEVDLTQAQQSAGVRAAALGREPLAPHSDMLPSALSLLRHATTTDPHDSKRREEERAKQAQKVTPFGPRDLHGMNRVGGAAASPAGDLIVFPLRQLEDPTQPYHEEKNCKSSTSLWLINVARERTSDHAEFKTVKLPHRQQLTNPSLKRDFNPVWLDAHTISFLSDRSGAPQIWAIDTRGGEAYQLSKFPLGIDNLQFNTAKSFFAFTAAVYPNLTGSDVFEATVKRDEEEQKNPAKFLKYSSLFVRRWDVWHDKKRSHVFLHSAARSADRWQLVGKPVDAMSGIDIDCPIPPFGGSEQFAIAPAGDELAYSAMGPRDSSVAWSTNSHVYTVPILHEAGGLRVTAPPVCLTSHNEGYDQQPSYSPDGKSILYLSMARPQYESDKRRLMVYDRASTRITQLAPKFDVSVSAAIWSSDSKQLFLTAESAARQMIFSLTFDSEPKPIISERSNDNVVLLGKNTLIYTKDSFTSPAELYACRIDGAQEQQLTDVNSEKLKRLLFPLSTPSEFFFKGANNDQVQGWIFKPSNFHKGTKYPVACVIHGGPQGAITDHWHLRWNPQTLAAQGFAVVCINFHGSTGFGQAFVDSIGGDWGGKPFQDIMLGMDHVLANYDFVDASRTAALGASYGGYMINWINGHTDRFKCLVNHDGIFNMTNMYYSTEELFFPEYEFRGLPWKSDQYEKFSPHKFVDKWKTPTLVIHGGKDYRVVDVEGIATFTALQRRGIPSELLFFPEENHWVLNPANAVVWHDTIHAWLHRWL